jgi:hypothetical protein
MKNKLIIAIILILGIFIFSIIYFYYFNNKNENLYQNKDIDSLSQNSINKLLQISFESDSEFNVLNYIDLSSYKFNIYQYDNEPLQLINNNFLLARTNDTCSLNFIFTSYYLTFISKVNNKIKYLILYKIMLKRDLLELYIPIENSNDIELNFVGENNFSKKLHINNKYIKMVTNLDTSILKKEFPFYTNMIEYNVIDSIYITKKISNTFLYNSDTINTNNNSIYFVDVFLKYKTNLKFRDKYLYYWFINDALIQIDNLFNKLINFKSKLFLNEDEIILEFKNILYKLQHFDNYERNNFIKDIQKIEIKLKSNNKLELEDFDYSINSFLKKLCIDCLYFELKYRNSD